MAFHVGESGCALTCREPRPWSSERVAQTLDIGRMHQHIQGGTP